MDIAVAVGLITAGSTLAGGTIASVTSLKVQRNQIGHQGMLAQTERMERHADQRRAIRRDVYLQLLNKLDEVDVLITKYWKTTPPKTLNQPANEERVALEKGLRSFDAMINFVRLEGPDSVVIAAVQASKTFLGELFFLSAVAFDNTGNGAALSRLAEREYSEYHVVRSDAKNGLISAAKLALEEAGSDGH